jgi:hypothetical protein
LFLLYFFIFFTLKKKIHHPKKKIYFFFLFIINAKKTIQIKRDQKNKQTNDERMKNFFKKENDDENF